MSPSQIQQNIGDQSGYHSSLFICRQGGGSVQTCSEKNKKNLAFYRQLLWMKVHVYLEMIWISSSAVFIQTAWFTASELKVTSWLTQLWQEIPKTKGGLPGQWGKFIKGCLFPKIFLLTIVVTSLGSNRYGSRRQSRTSSNISCQDYKAVKRKNRSKSFGAVFSEIDSTIQKNVKY